MYLFIVRIKHYIFTFSSYEKNKCPSVCSSSRKSKDEFVKQPHPTKIVKIGALFVFLKKTL